MVDLGRASAPCSAEEADEILATLKDQYDYQDHPWTPGQTEKRNKVGEALREAASTIIACVPPSADRSVALRKLREAQKDANSAIVHEGKY